VGEGGARGIGLYTFVLLLYYLLYYDKKYYDKEYYYNMDMGVHASGG
jgi:hypothetical protein